LQILYLADPFPNDEHSRIDVRWQAVFPDEVFTPDSFAKVEEVVHCGISLSLSNHRPLFRALADGRVGQRTLRRLFLKSTRDDDMQMLYNTIASPSSSLRRLECVELVFSKDSPDGLYLLGRMLFAEGVCPGLQTFSLRVSKCPDECVRAFIQGAMEEGPGTVQLDALGLCTLSSAGLDLAPLVDAMSRGPDGPFSKLRKLSVNGETRTLQSLIMGAENAMAPLADGTHDWTATIEELKLFRPRDQTMVQRLAGGWPLFPKLRHVTCSSGFRVSATAFAAMLEAALREQYTQGLRLYPVMVGGGM
jgi:hypothetical protein